MNDLEICKRIAEIEGCIDIHENNGNIWHKKDYETLKYNPLTDDALCFQLMVKYDCDLMSPYRPNNDTSWECQIFPDDCFDAVSIHNDSPNKAICLSIIEAHKEQ